MTLTTLVGPSAALISKEVLTTAGTYNRTPPNGANYWLAKLRGAAGNVLYNSRCQAASGAGAFVQGGGSLAPDDTFTFTVGAGGSDSVFPSFSSAAKNSSTVLIAAAGGGANGVNNVDISVWAGSGGVATGQQGQILDRGTAVPSSTGGSQTAAGADDNRYYAAVGGRGYFAGGNGAAAGGGSSYVDASISHSAASPGMTQAPTFGAMIASLPGSPSDPDLGPTVGAGSFASYTSADITGHDGGIVIAWYSGDPYAAGLLS